MKVINIEAIEPKVMPKHEKVYSRRIWGPEKGGKYCSVGYNYLFSNGGAEMHTHESEHIFIILEGSCKYYDGENKHIYHKGQAFVVEPGDPHQITGTGEEDCLYITITSPPARSK